jgi:hypothetical protein
MLFWWDKRPNLRWAEACGPALGLTANGLRLLRLSFSDPGLGELGKEPEKPGINIAANVVRCRAVGDSEFPRSIDVNNRKVRRVLVCWEIYTVGPILFYIV